MDIKATKNEKKSAPRYVWEGFWLPKKNEQNAASPEKEKQTWGRQRKKNILGIGTRERSRKEASVRWPSLTEPFTSLCQGQGLRLKHPASITHALCCVFNSQVKSINGYPPDWLELINMAMQDANGRWGRSETPCQTLVLQGQNSSKFMLCGAGWQNSSHCVLPGPSTVLPGRVNPRQVHYSLIKHVFLYWTILFVII